MASFKILDLRCQLINIASASVTFATPGAIDRNDVSLLRAAAMLTVFNSGRDCYWDDRSKVFTTDPVSQQPPDTKESGQVSSWEIKIPLTGNIGMVLMLLTATQTAEVQATSGNRAVAFVTLQLEEQQAVTALAVLGSKYRYFDAGSKTLRNTDILK